MSAECHKRTSHPESRELGRASRAEALIYFSLSGGQKTRDPSQIPDPVTRAGEAVEQLKRRIAWFNQEQTPYRPRVKPYRADIVGDYDHLARVKEWSSSGWGEEP